MAETGTAVARKKDRVQQIYEGLVHPDDDFETRQKAMVTAREMRELEIRTGAQKAIAGQTWGRNFSPELQFAMAKWCEDKNLDPIRHIDVLGGNPYLNSEYYIDRLREHKNYHRSYPIVIAPFARAEIPEDVFTDGKIRAKMALEEMRDNVKLFHLQRKHRPHAYMNDPKYKDTCAAVVVVIEMWGRDAEGNRMIVEYEGVNEAGSCGRKSKSGGGLDQIGDADPVATATTRAYRKAIWKVPGMSPKVINDEVELTEMRDTIKQGRTEGSTWDTLLEEIERMLKMKAIPKDVRAYCSSIYEDWVAGAFQNITVGQLITMRDELDAGLQGIDEDTMCDPETGEVILEGEALCPHCNASIDVGEPHGPDCPMVEPKSCEGCGSPAGEPHGKVCPVKAEDMDEDDARERVERQRELDMLRKEGDGQ